MANIEEANNNRFGITIDATNKTLKKGKQTHPIKRIRFAEVGGTLVCAAGTKRIDVASPSKSPEAYAELEAIRTAVENLQKGGGDGSGEGSPGGSQGDPNSADGEKAPEDGAGKGNESDGEYGDGENSGESSDNSKGEGSGEKVSSEATPKPIQDLIDKHGIEEPTEQEIQELKDAFDDLGIPVPDHVPDSVLSTLWQAAKAIAKEIDNKDLETAMEVAQEIKKQQEQLKTKMTQAGQLLENADWVLTAIKDLLQRVESLELWREQMEEWCVEIENKIKKAANSGGKSSGGVKKIIVVTPDFQKIGVVKGELYHERFEEALQVVATGMAVCFVGPAGTGKTHAAAQIAKALGFNFRAVGGHPHRDQAELVGFENPIKPGHFSRGEIRDMYENGGVFFQDEFDTCGPGYIKGMNNFTDHSPSFSFPDGVVQRHKDFRVILGANTIGQGPDSQYAAAQVQDLSSLDRVYMINWELDPQLELAAALSYGEHGQEWVERVRLVREEVEIVGDQGVHIGMRASVNGSMLLSQGIPVEKVVDGLMRAHMGPGSQDALAEVLRRVSKPMLSLKVVNNNGEASGGRKKR